jgi:prepilin-type N-terminal cleavage/methylation domain-containing protein
MNATVLSPQSAVHSQRAKAFTLLELLTVIAIIGVIAALAMPVLGKFKPNYTASASRQLLDDLARARQLAISQRTTVCMVFVPTNFWDKTQYPQVISWGPADWAMATNNLLDKQLVGYNFVALRGLGDQPGNPTPRYLSSWRTLPEGSIIPTNKFLPNSFAAAIPYTNNPVAFQFNGFDQTTLVPFPLENTPPYSGAGPTKRYVALSYIAFDYMGRMITLDTVTGQPKPAGRDAIIPLAKGAASFSRGPDKKPTMGPASFSERPPGNSTNAFNLVYVSWLTGRARGIQMEIQ